MWNFSKCRHCDGRPASRNCRRTCGVSTRLISHAAIEAPLNVRAFTMTTGPISLSLSAFLMAMSAPLCAQDYPARPVELIVPFAAGGGTDLMARLLGEGLHKRHTQPFPVINRPGANTNLGTLSVVRAKPDGYTLTIASVGLDRKSTRLNSSHIQKSRMPSSA